MLTTLVVRFLLSANLEKFSSNICKNISLVQKEYKFNPKKRVILNLM
tara:strand:- start:169 stop:309 length:141 start_codon:yes stop_codon:yes gene_type:complete